MVDPGPASALVVNGAFRGQRVTGQQRYATEIVRALDESGRGFTEIAPSVWTAAHKRASWTWVQTVLPAKSRGDWLLSLTARAPLWHRQHVITVHDLFPVTHPEWYSTSYVRLHAPLLRHLLGTARGVVTVSQPVAWEIRERGLCPVHTPIVIAPNAPSPLVKTEDELASPAVEQILRCGRYFLSVGTIDDPRKNLSSVIAAYGRLPLDVRRETPLVIVGASAAGIFATSERAETEGLVVLGFVSDVDLFSLYGPRAVLVSASFDEGFGLPLVEARHRGATLAVSDIPIYRWVCGSAANYFDPHDVDSVRDVLAQVVHEHSVPEALPREYTWKASASTIADLVDSLA